MTIRFFCQTLHTLHRAQQFHEREGMTPTVFRYTPDADHAHAPDPVLTPGVTDPFLGELLAQSHDFVQNNMREREAKRTRTGRCAQKKPKAQPKAAPRSTAYDSEFSDRRHIDYRRSEATCAICIAQFHPGEAVCRLKCDHAYHCDCVHD